MNRPPMPSLSLRDRVLAWVVTGPVGRLIAFFWDLGAYWWSWARGRLRGSLRR